MPIDENFKKTLNTLCQTAAKTMLRDSTLQTDPDVATAVNIYYGIIKELNGESNTPTSTTV